MKRTLRNGFWVGMGLATALAWPAEAYGAGRGSETFDRSGTAFDRREGGSTWRRAGPGGWGRRDARSRAPARAAGAVRAVSRGGSGDPGAPEPTGALLFGAGVLAIRSAARRGRAR